MLWHDLLAMGQEGNPEISQMMHPGTEELTIDKYFRKCEAHIYKTP